MNRKALQIGAIAAAIALIGWFGIGHDRVGSAAAETPITSTAVAASATAQNTVTVGASGSIKVEPDVAYLNFAVEARGKTAQEAQQAGAEKFTAVEKVLYDTYKLDKKDVQTTGFNVQPEYNYTEKDGQVLKGYLASHQVQITYRDLNNIGKLLDALSAAGANRMDGVQFGTEKQDQYELDALKKAMTNADAKANVLATSANRQLGEVVNIVQGNTAPIPVVTQFSPMAKAMASSSADAATSVQSGQIEITADVTVQYELK